MHAFAIDENGVDFVSSSSATLGVILDFVNCNEEDIISTREDALARLRFRSTPLQGTKCSEMKEGELVLAMHEGQSRILFYDAVVEKIHRVKHSNRVYCRCTFKLKWHNTKLKEDTVTVPSKSIMKLSDKDIDSHPVVAAFLTALNPDVDVEFPSSCSLLEETNCEFELHGMLEKQVEEISKLADGLECSEDTILGLMKAKLSGHGQSKATLASHLTSLSRPNGLRRSTRSLNKQSEVEVKEHMDVPLLSPLAARAALASLVHELPVESEFPIYKIEKEFHKVPLSTDLRDQSLNGKGISLMSKSSLKDNSFEILHPLEKSISDSLSETRDLSISCVSSSREEAKNSDFEKCSNMSTSQEKAAEASKELEDKKLCKLTVSKHSRNLVADDKSCPKAATRRLTRSAAQREMLNSTVEQQGAANGEVASSVSTWCTQSVDEKERHEGNTKQDLLMSNLTQNVQDLYTTEGNENKKNLSVSSSADTSSNVMPESKRIRAFSKIAVNEENEGITSLDAESQPSLKRKASAPKNTAPRFSPRLRFLPRTRSQVKRSPVC
ncbi:uncharacterized protein [Typha angustifolia]|uniref:uncharacterized protein isoform X2 n=1 Tax=Typha angustifolia TaxID=59011 RepID=UPI003C2AD32C